MCDTSLLSLIPEHLITLVGFVVFFLSFIKSFSKKRNPQNTPSKFHEYHIDFGDSVVMGFAITFAFFFLIALPIPMLLFMALIAVSARLIDKMYYRESKKSRPEFE